MRKGKGGGPPTKRGGGFRSIVVEKWGEGTDFRGGGGEIGNERRFGKNHRGCSREGPGKNLGGKTGGKEPVGLAGGTQKSVKSLENVP